jgi:two-component system nitrate/nitrite response regulator NarL
MIRKTAEATAPRIRIVVIDESELFRAGISKILDGHPGFEVVGVAGNQSEALSLIRLEHPDVMIMSVNQNDGKNLESLPEILASAESMRALVITGSADKDLHRRAILLGAVGLVSRDNPPDVLIRAVEKVYAGEAWLDRSTTASVLRDMSPRNRAQKRNPDEIKIERLTNREREVIKLAGEGLKNKQIAARLFISDITVHHHITSIYSKLEVANRLELLIYAYRNGLAELPH